MKDEHRLVCAPPARLAMTRPRGLRSNARSFEACARAVMNRLHSLSAIMQLGARRGASFD